MDIPLNAEVTCADGPCGKSLAVIANTTNRVVTHIVVRTDGGNKYRVPVDQITESTPQTIHLRATQAQVRGEQSFETRQPGPRAEGDLGPTDFTDTQVRQTETRTVLPRPVSINPDDPSPERVTGAETVERLGVHEVAIHRGAKVVAADGQVGEVEEFLVGPTDYAITHVILRKGLLWGEKVITIPAAQIDALLGDEVYLTLDKASIEMLPAVKPGDRSGLL